MRKFLKVGLVLALTFTLALAGCANADDEKDVTLTFGVTPWTSTVPPTEVAKLILQDMGYEVKLQNADAGVVYTGLAGGDLDIFMDAWLPDMHKNYMEQYGDKLVDTAISYNEGELGWVIPKYVENINSVDDIVGNEDLFDGKIYGIEEGAGMTMTSAEMIEAYGLDLEYVASGEPAMLTQAQKMIQKEEPVLFLGWRPHDMFAKWDLKVLPGSKGYFKTSEVHVITTKGLEEKAPEAFNFLKNWSMPVGDIEQMILDINNGADPEERAQQWIDENQDKVNAMLGK